MKELEHGDKIVFRVGDKEYPYTVSDEFLIHLQGDNDAVFIALGLNKAQRLDLASYHYGYLANQGDWPEFNTKDYAAATRLVKALYDLCNIHNSKKQ